MFLEREQFATWSCVIKIDYVGWKESEKVKRTSVCGCVTCIMRTVNTNIWMRTAEKNSFPVSSAFSFIFNILKAIVVVGSILDTVHECERLDFNCWYAYCNS